MYSGSTFRVRGSVAEWLAVVGVSQTALISHFPRYAEECSSPRPNLVSPRPHLSSCESCEHYEHTEGRAQLCNTSSPT